MADFGVMDHHYRKFSPGEYRRRHELMRDLMRTRGLDGMIAYGGYKEMFQVNARWLSGLREPLQFYVFLPLKGEPAAWNSLYSQSVAAKRLSAIARTEWGGPSIARTVAAHVKKAGLASGRLGLVGVHAARGITLPMDHYLIWQEELPGVEFVNITRDVEDIHMIKSPEELAFYERGAAYTDYAMAELIKAIRPGVSETTLFGRLLVAASECGGSMDFALLGSTSMDDPDMPYPWHNPTERCIQPGDVILNEVSVSYSNCSGQLIVPISVGQPTAEYRELYAIARQTLERVRQTLRPGATRDDVLEAGRTITDAGLTSQASLIHGWPNPPMRPTIKLGQRGLAEGGEDFTLRENMLVMTEPNPVTQDLKRGIFLGALHVVTPEGGRCLHRHTLDFLCV